jgi:glycosyltransferase involved in cell wall biosynthesis
MVSVLITTQNEESTLPACLASLQWCDDVHLYDSGSTDATVDIAERAGALVSVRKPPSSQLSFGGDEAGHRNWALRNIPFKYPWVFSIDADEQMTEELAHNVVASSQEPGEHVAFRVRRRDFLDGKWLRHAQATPFYMRLFRPEKVHYHRVINPPLIADGAVTEVDGYLDHFPFAKGMRHWLDRHNSYSTLEARQIVDDRIGGTPFSFWSAFYERDFHRRRFHQKELFYRLPFRPALKFALLYVVKGGFLDGSAGLTYAVLQSFYEYMIVLKTREISASKQGRTAPSLQSIDPAASTERPDR